MKIRYFIIVVLLNSFYTSSNASSPVWTFLPLTATTLTVPINSSAIVEYKVTNQSRKSHTLAMMPITGVHQVTTGSEVCAKTFVLGYQQSCTLILQIDGSLLQQSITRGPEVCQTSSTGVSNPNECYQPSVGNQLNIKRSSIPGSATISASVSALALSVNCPTPGGSCLYSNAALTGTPRIITVTNTSDTYIALNAAYSASSLPSGTTITPFSCDIMPHGTCVFTITPGQTASAEPGNTSPTPISLSISGSNTNVLSADVSILTYGSVFQSGYVFAINDTTLNTASVSGKVAALVDQSPGIAWQPGCSNSPSCTATNANSYQDGADNTTAIVAAFTVLSIPPSTYAAGLCDTLTSGGYTGWYLPAICETGYGDGSDPNYPCGSSSNPTLQNMQSNLADNDIGNLTDSYWSSTQTVTVDPLLYADYNWFASGGFQPGNFKDTLYFTRCVRGFSP